MGTFDTLPWIAACSALLGAVIGAAAAVVAQYVAQNAIAARERTARERLEQRTHALFAAYLNRVRHAIDETRKLPYWNFPEIRRLVEPPRTMAQEPSTMLALNASAIRSVIEAVAVVDAAIRQAQDGTKNAGKSNVELIGDHTYIRDDSSRQWVSNLFDKPTSKLVEAIRELETVAGTPAVMPGAET